MIKSTRQKLIWALSGLNPKSEYWKKYEPERVASSHWEWWGRLWLSHHHEKAAAWSSLLTIDVSFESSIVFYSSQWSPQRNKKRCFGIYIDWYIRLLSCQSRPNFKEQNKVLTKTWQLCVLWFLLKLYFLSSCTRTVDFKNSLKTGQHLVKFCCL